MLDGHGNSGCVRLLVTLGDVVVVIVVVFFVVVGRRRVRWRGLHQLTLHLFFFHVNEIVLDAVVVLAFAMRHELVQVLFIPSIKDVVVGFVVVVNAIGRGSRSGKGECRCFFFVFVIFFVAFLLLFCCWW